MRIKLTKRTVDAAAASSKAEFIWDTDLKGFGLRVSPKGRKVFVAQYRVRNAGGPARRVTVGHYGTLTVEQARIEAKRILAEAAIGQDPLRNKIRDASVGGFNAIMERFLSEHVDAKRKPRTAEEYRRLAKLHLLPRFGRRQVADTSRSDISQMHRQMANVPYAANRALALMSKFFNWCELHGLIAEHANPCRHIEKYREHKRERFLSAAEMATLGAVLKEVDCSPWVKAAIRLLLLTGARLSEILTLQWQHVDLDRGLLLLPDSKTGKRAIHLNGPAVQVLRELPRLEGNPFVICGTRSGRHLVNLEKPWRDIRRKAGLEDVRLHDLRHSFASVAASEGVPLLMIGKLLGHSQPQTTARYAHLAADPLKEANRLVGSRIFEAMDVSEQT